MAFADVTYCNNIEARAAIGVTPSYTGVGFALAFDLPIGVEVCIVKSLTTPMAELRAWGPGISYSSEGVLASLREALENIIDLIVAGNDVSLSQLLSRYSPREPLAELAYTSIFGTLALASSSFIPVDADPIWLVAIRLGKPIDWYKVVANIGLDAIHYAVLEAATKRFDDGMGSLTRHIVKALSEEPYSRSIKGFIDEALTLGLIGLTIDYSGKILAVLTERFSDVVELQALARIHGFTVAYGRLVTPFTAS